MPCCAGEGRYSLTTMPHGQALDTYRPTCCHTTWRRQRRLPRGLPAMWSAFSGSHQNVQVCGDRWERKKQNSLSIMKRAVTGDTRAQRNSLLGVASQAAWASGEVLDCAMAEAMSGCMIMQQQGSVSMSLVHITTKDHENFLGLGPCRCPRAVQSCPHPLPSAAVGRAGSGS